MSQDSNNSSTLNSTGSQNLTQFFIGTPSHDEIQQYFLRQKKLADLKVLESSPDLESSPELSESFEMYLQQRKQKVEDEKRKLRMAPKNYVDSPRTSKFDSPELTRMSNVHDETINDRNNTMNMCNDDSFLAMEKMCEKTMNLDNESDNLIDITAFEATMYGKRESLKKSVDETNLDQIEAPSFFNNSSLISPNKNSPIHAVHANRPSTILELSEGSTMNKTNMTSYRTAYTRSDAESSVYKTANEDTFSKTESIDENLIIQPKFSIYDGMNTTKDLLDSTDPKKRATSSKTESIDANLFIQPKLRSFYDGMNLTKDSLDSTEHTKRVADMTMDSLDPNSYAGESSSGVESSYDHHDDSADNSGGERLDDTLDRIEFMLAQNEKMKAQAQAQNTPAQETPSQQRPMPTFITAKLPVSPFTVTPSPNKAKQPVSASKMTPKLLPKVFSKPGSAHKSPMMKFSPAAKSPMSPSNSAFKKPVASGSKIPQTFSNKKYQHVESPLARYIKNTPGAPLASTARTLPGMGSGSKNFNFRDSDSFAKENKSSNTTYKGSSLPQRAKTKTTAATQLFDNRDTKIVGGAKMQSLIGNCPTVTVHEGHVTTTRPGVPRIFQSQLMNETAISEQSFGDLSLVSGDVSIQVLEGAKRFK